MVLAPPARRPSPAAGSQVQQLLVEGADPGVPVGDVHLEDPVAAAPGRIQAAHRMGVAGRDITLYLAATDLLVRELAHQMAGDRAGEIPAILLGEPHDVRVQLLAGDVGMAVE